MESKKIVVEFHLSNGGSITTEVDSGNPVLSELITMITKHRDVIEISKTSITEYPDNFDHEEFRNVIVKTFNSYLEEIRINDDELSKALATLPKKSKEVSQ
jgi:lipoate-protein ligase A